LGVGPINSLWSFLSGKPYELGHNNDNDAKAHTTLGQVS
jgi:hypothetical protein